MKDIFTKILICHDGSKYADKALAKAISLAEKFNSKLFLLYVIEKSTVDFWNNSKYVGIVSKSLEKRKKNFSSLLKKNLINFRTKKGNK
ncbi:MAG: universal stress protein [Nitrosopumilus sp.]|nr:universal stress protein [Nitrosopumilus sp.]